MKQEAGNDIVVEENKSDEPGNEEEPILPANVPRDDENAKQDELTLDKLKKGNDKLKKSIKILKTNCYPLVNHVIHLLKDSIEGSLKIKKDGEAKIKKLKLQIYATLQVLSEGNETEASYKQIQEDEDRQIYFYEINRKELLQDMRDQTLEIKKHNDDQQEAFGAELINVRDSHSDIKREVESKEERLLNTTKEMNKLFDFFNLIEEEKYVQIEDDPDLPTSFKEYMNSEDAKKEFEKFYNVQLTVSFGVLYYRRTK
jgi:hypothetical protein